MITEVLIHSNSTFVYNVEDFSFFHFFEDGLSVVFALEKHFCAVVCTHNDDATVRIMELHIDVKDVFLSNAFRFKWSDYYQECKLVSSFHRS